MLADQVTRYLEKIKESTPLPARVVLWDGTEIALGDQPNVTIRLRDRSALTQLINPSLDKLGDAYVRGKIDIDGPLTDAMRVATGLAESAPRRRAGSLPKWARWHNRKSDRDAISYHYDVSNAFYQQFLDEQMVYSCAYYEHDDLTLEQAQTAKLDLICRKLGLQQNQRLLDIGCGWGAMAIHAATYYGARVTGVTISQNQYDLACQRVHDAGLTDRIDIRLQDYRDIPERDHFDRIVSIGMFEHVGLKHLRDYFGRINDMLVPGGVVLNHGITSANADSRSTDNGAGEFIGKYVFPDGELPHVSLAIAEMSATGLEIVDAESLRRHYGRTLWEWSQRFDSRIETIAGLATPEKVRIWRAYLAGCAYAFDNSWINIYQLLASRPFASDARIEIGVPMTREYMYQENTSEISPGKNA